MSKKVENVYYCDMNKGITETPKFAEKGLATHAINTGVKCDNNCLYCSTGAMLRMHPAFKEHGLDAFSVGYAVIDKGKPAKVLKDARGIRGKGMVEMCTTTDAYSPAAREYHFGRKFLKAVLENSELHVRVLTKNHQVEEDFDLIKKYRDRVLVGLSITATPDKSNIMKIVEENASPIKERMRVLRKAHRMGLRTYGMFCPLLPGIADSPKQIDRYIQFAESIGAEEIFSEAVNPRGKALILTQEGLQKHGYEKEARAVESVRRRVGWSEYSFTLIRNIQSSMRKHSNINKLRFLLYPSGLSPQHLRQIKKNSRGVIWL